MPETFTIKNGDFRCDLDLRAAVGYPTVKPRWNSPAPFNGEYPLTMAQWNKLLRIAFKAEDENWAALDFLGEQLESIQKDVQKEFKAAADRERREHRDLRRIQDRKERIGAKQHNAELRNTVSRIQTRATRVRKMIGALNTMLEK